MTNSRTNLSLLIQ